MKFERVKGDVPVFSEDYDGRDRTVFGGTEQSNDIDDQFTDEFKKGWGIVGKNEFPTLQDFNALGFTHSTLLSYLYQAGVPEWDSATQYYIGATVSYAGELWISKRDIPTSAPTFDQLEWKLIIAGEYVGNSNGKWMREGAFGLGTSRGAAALEGDLGILSRTQFFVASQDELPLEWGQTEQIGGWVVNRCQRPLALFFGNNPNLYVSHRSSEGWTQPYLFQTDYNTRTDKNNVLHSGTSTPLTTLNTSDMAQDVVNREDMTVTSGAVYRESAKKADTTYVDTELAKKRDLSDSVFGSRISVNTGSNSLQLVSDNDSGPYLMMTGWGGQKWYALPVDRGGALALASDIPTVTQSLGTSTTNVMSQKAVTDELEDIRINHGLGYEQNWVDVTSQRSVNTNYVNSTGKPIFISIYSNNPELGSKSIKVSIDEIVVTYADTVGATDVPVNLVVPVGSTYKVELTAFILGADVFWTELR